MPCIYLNGIGKLTLGCADLELWCDFFILFENGILKDKRWENVAHSPFCHTGTKVKVNHATLIYGKSDFWSFAAREGERMAINGCKTWTVYKSCYASVKLSEPLMKAYKSERLFFQLFKRQWFYTLSLLYLPPEEPFMLLNHVIRIVLSWVWINKSF